MFHMGCMAEMKDVHLEQLQQRTTNEFICPRCEHTYHSIQDERPWTGSLLETKARRLGINYDTHWSNTSDYTKHRRLNNVSAMYTSCGNSND